MTLASQEATLFDLPHRSTLMETHEDLIIIAEGQAVLNQSYTTALERLEALADYLRTAHAHDQLIDGLLVELRNDLVADPDPNALLQGLSLDCAHLDITVYIDTRLAPATLPAKIYSIITRSNNPAVALKVQHFTSAQQRTESLRQQIEEAGVTSRLSASDSTLISTLAGALAVANNATAHIEMVSTDRLNDGSALNDGSLLHDPAISATTTISSR